MINESILRTELAAVFRGVARLDWHEGVANHFSVAVSDDGTKFLINPVGRHFSRMRASDLLLVDANRADTMNQPKAPDPSAWCLHGYLHRHLPAARCLLHTHSPYATALASLANWQIQPCDQNACRFFNRVAYDEEFGGMLLEAQEPARQAAILGNKKVLLMRGHGILTVGANVGEAFDLLYYFERTCRNQWLAMTTRQPLFRIADDIAEKTAQQWDNYPTQKQHLAELCAILDKTEPDYRD